jgi:hypothetical protein
MLLIEAQYIINHNSHPYKIPSNNSVVIQSNSSNIHQNCPKHSDKVVYDVFFKWQKFLTLPRLINMIIFLNAKERQSITHFRSIVSEHQYS